MITTNMVTIKKNFTMTMRVIMLKIGTSAHVRSSTGVVNVNLQKTGISVFAKSTESTG